MFKSANQQINGQWCHVHICTFVSSFVLGDKPTNVNVAPIRVYPTPIAGPSITRRRRWVTAASGRNPLRFKDAISVDLRVGAFIPMISLVAN